MTPDMRQLIATESHLMDSNIEFRAFEFTLMTAIEAETTVC